MSWNIETGQLNYIEGFNGNVTGVGLNNGYLYIGNLVGFVGLGCYLWLLFRLWQLSLPKVIDLEDANYARAYLEGRLSEEHLDGYRQELSSPTGLSSYPHPWLMPEFWQFPTVSMGLGPLFAIYQALLDPELVQHPQRVRLGRRLHDPGDHQVTEHLITQRVEPEIRIHPGQRVIQQARGRLQRPRHAEPVFLIVAVDLDHELS